MKAKHKIFALLLTLAVSLAGCGEQTASIYKPARLAINTISQVEMTARERLLNDVHRGYTFMFDYKVDESYGTVNVWVEHYYFGVLAAPRDPSTVSTFSVGSDDPGPMSGAIVIAVSPLIDRAGVVAADKSTVRMLSTNGQVTTYGAETMLDIPQKYSGGYIGVIQANTPIDGELELAQVSYTMQGASWSQNPETNAELRKKHSITYLIMCEFVKKA